MAVPFSPSYAESVHGPTGALETPGGLAPVQKLASLPTPESLAQRLRIPIHSMDPLPPAQITSPAAVPIMLATPRMQTRGM